MQLLTGVAQNTLLHKAVKTTYIAAGGSESNAETAGTVADVGASVFGAWGAYKVYKAQQLSTVVVENSSWVYGSSKSEAKWANQFAKRGWTAEQVTEAISKGKRFDALNLVNKANGATRYVHPISGKSVVIDNVTKELLQVGGEGFLW
jgi:Colicin E5 ribonuclease domain